MKLDTSVELGRLATSEGVIANARVAETVDALEQLTAGWCQQIEQVQKVPIVILSVSLIIEFFNAFSVDFKKDMDNYREFNN